MRYVTFGILAAGLIVLLLAGLLVRGGKGLR